MKNNTGTLFIISGPSGSGKTSLVREVLKRPHTCGPLERVITYTTKQPRAEEVQGSSYHFVTEDEFEKLIEQNHFIEWSKDYGSYYGSPMESLCTLEEGISLLSVLDRSGAQQVKERFSPAVLIWIQPPSVEELRARLEKRGTDSPKSVEKRLSLAEEEISLEKTTPIYEYHLLNDDFDRAVSELQSIICKYC